MPQLNVDSPQNPPFRRFHEWPAEALYSVAKQQITGQSVELPNLEGALKMWGEPSRGWVVYRPTFLVLGGEMGGERGT